MKILIVDDREEDRVLMRYALERQGWRITEAADGAEALALLRLDPPDLVISDALMPKMDGFGLLRAMKQEPGLAGIPFIFYTATYNEQNEYELAMSLGAAALLAKPLPPDELPRRVVAIVANFPKPGGG
ncbi:MAG: response regulator, partial [Desulfobacteraceae bacterium]|nr:response regulator [Desulfobacteraceae bacterium]